MSEEKSGEERRGGEAERATPRVTGSEAEQLQSCNADTGKQEADKQDKSMRHEHPIARSGGTTDIGDQNSSRETDEAKNDDRPGRHGIFLFSQHTQSLP